MGAGANRQVFLLHRRAQKRFRGALPTSAINRALGVSGAKLPGAIIVRVAWDAERLCPIKKRLAQRVRPVTLPDFQFTATSATVVVIAARPILQPFEHRQDVGIAPTGIAALRPMVEIGRGAAIENVAVDGG